MTALAASLAALLHMGRADSAPQLVVDVETGSVLSEQQSSASWHPASLTKIMTAHLALKAMEQGSLEPDSLVIMSGHAAAQPPTKLGLPEGHGLKLLDALKVILTRSANDVAVAIAETVSGSEDEFARLMTREARNLGMSATIFRNASGLPDPQQVTTARDMAVLGIAVLKQHPEHVDLFSMRSVDVAGRTLRNTNRLLGRYPGMNGMKTGYICSSGFNIVATAERGGRKILAVIMGQPSTPKREAVTVSVFDRAFTMKPSGQPLAAFGIKTPSPAHDMRPYGCGKTWRQEDLLPPATTAFLPEIGPMPIFRSERSPDGAGSPISAYYDEPETSQPFRGRF